MQFSSVGLDPSGDIICAGSQDTFEIFVWSMQTGRLLEVLSVPVVLCTVMIDYIMEYMCSGHFALAAVCVGGPGSDGAT